MKKLWPLALIAAGALLVLGSAAYGVLLVGIPGPDDPPAQLARQETQGSFTFAVFLLGVFVLFFGAVAGIIRLVVWWSRSHGSIR